MPTDPRKQPLTVDIFNRHVLPQLKVIIAKAVDEAMQPRDVKNEAAHVELDQKIEAYRMEVIGFKEEVMGEIKILRDEVALNTGQYQRMDKRTTRIEEHLQLPALDL